jgi:uncharacterized protein involved in response to NO
MPKLVVAGQLLVLAGFNSNAKLLQMHRNKMQMESTAVVVKHVAYLFASLLVEAVGCVG